MIEQTKRNHQINTNKLIMLIIGVLLLIIVPYKVSMIIDTFLHLFNNDPFIIEWLIGVIIIALFVAIVMLSYMLYNWLTDNNLEEI